ncbi:type II toxin-antitoxin system RelE/ParE family toxin [Hydrogenovibrio marinus]|uniref:Plasmid maintenance system killer n=1 Tax=Hydrogenovibrio marinus TaxID=28885 RepID=A0A066ZW62_HYDMR|nr:type II toxin-antitoxin system RelE/ParE family toxin [Hydrogenovibrio marinus]KDN96524.1 plasmid maintenance system killer [Hydrogenovibrio marinus]BBN60272.1 plasmid maintenance system killer protein [Hydrogenovibrio marinus]
MIQTFKDKDAEKVFKGQFSKKLPQAIQRKARMKLRMLDAALTLEDLLIPPANRLETLSGDRSGQHSIRINQQWRVCFVWNDGQVQNVEIVDYH